MKRLSLWLLIISGLTSGSAYCQQIDRLRLEQTIIAAYKKAYPACVQLYAYDTVAKQQAGGAFSGIVVRKDGYILTAAHVTTPGAIYKVIFPDGKTGLATGLGKIELAQDKTIPDVAMIKIVTPGKWPFAAIGSSSSLKRDEPCISIAYPESLSQPKPILRFGYISNVKNDRGFIKSTCLMEPGDSGGPLFDYMGRVIGLHSAIEIPEASNYDVPVDLYLKYWTALNNPQIYTTFPRVKDPVPTDSLKNNIITLPGLENYRASFQGATACEHACLTITSQIKGKVQKINGTLFSLSHLSLKYGLYRQVIVSKSSLIGDDPVIIGTDKSKIIARVIARDKENDLALLIPFSEISGGISYNLIDTTTVNNIQAGRFLISPRPDTTSVISITGSFIFAMPKIINAGFLGIGFSSRSAPFTIAHIFPNLNASIYQLKTGDQIISINDSTSKDLNGYFSKLNKLWPGDTIHVQVIRNGIALTENIVLDTIPQRHFNHPAEMFTGGKSYRRDGFKNIFTHDAILKPTECGGPLFDFKGDFYGINIARYSRTSCLAIPPISIYRFINKTLYSY